ncbi:MAG: response regulator [Opitutaceae bacterium]|nr:response regulator [Opitutaceae bacterium]
MQVQALAMKPDQLLPPVMIVDDDEDDVVLLTRRLKSAGVKNPLLHFRTGGDAFMFLKQFCPPESTRAKLPVVMFLDVNMQGLSGFDVLLWARQQPPLQGMKIYMLSGAKEEWDAQIAAKLGADDFLEKFPDPAVFNELLSDDCPPRIR